MLFTVEKNQVLVAVRVRKKIRVRVKRVGVKKNIIQAPWACSGNIACLKKKKRQVWIILVHIVW